MDFTINIDTGGSFIDSVIPTGDKGEQITTGTTSTFNTRN